MKIHSCSNLTLIELVISLAILATLSSILLNNFADIEVRERERETIFSGKMVKNVILGTDEKDGIGKFLSDMGRWPEIFIERDNYNNPKEERFLAYLYDRSIISHISSSESMFSHPVKITITKNILDLPNTPIFQNYAFPKVVMPIGWQGPYLNLTFPEKKSFSDGFGNPWKIITNHHFVKKGIELQEKFDFVQNPSSNKKIEIDGIASFGANNAENGIENGDSDYKFIFSRENNMANLNIALRVRDEYDSSRWNELKLNNSTAYIAKSYQAGEIVFIENTGIKHYYTCTENNNNTSPKQDGSDFSLTNRGWRYGTLNNVVTLNSVRVLIFSPAKRNANGTFIMESGFIRFMPYLFSETNKNILFPALHYCRESYDGSQIIGFDVDATTNENLDLDFSLGKLNKNSLRSRLFWEVSANTIPSNFRIEKLVPGRRQIFAFIGNYNNVKHTSSAISSLEWIEIKPGENNFTIYLEPQK